MPDFSSMKYVDLQNAMKVRGMPANGTRVRMIASLEEHFRWMREEHEKGQIFQLQCLRERAELMLTRVFKEEHSRVSLMDLPGEIRNMIYDLALFDPPSRTSTEVGVEHLDDYAEPGEWIVYANDDRFFTSRSEAIQMGIDSARLRSWRTLAVLNIIAALSKQVRQEVHTFFWARITVELHPSSLQPSCGLVQRFLEKIGSHGRSALAGLTVSPAHANYSYHHHQDYEDMITLLRECKNLQTLDLYLPMYTMMGPPDRKAMEDFFLHGHPLSSPSMDDLVGALHSIPKLRFVRLWTELDVVEPRHTVSYYLRDDSFLEFAFSGIREGRWVQELRTHLQARQDIEFIITGDLSQAEKYEEWLPRYVERRSWY